MKISRLTIREYAESLAIAFILAMIIRHFVAEAFRIPTSSMEPTLIGQDVGGDRILVSKFQFDLHPPRQWDIIVFKIDQHRIDFFRDRYANRVRLDIEPERNGTLHRSEGANYVNYVKRLVALPGQTIQVRNGDLFINGRIARKPKRVEDVLLVPISNDELLREQGDGFLDQWADNGDPGVSCSGQVLRFAAARSGAECFVRYRADIVDRVDTDPEGTRRRGSLFNVVGDLKLAFRFRHTGGAGQLVGQIREDGTTYSFHLPLGGPDKIARLLRDGVEIARAATPFEPDGEHRLAFSNVDARVVLRIDGDPLLDYEDNRPSQTRIERVLPRTPHTGTSSLEFGACACDVEVRDVRLWRDIYYTSDRDQQKFAVGAPFTLAADEYFVMGDNSPNSFDSRSWGVVKQSNLIGEAFFVFWPVSRWKFIN